MNSSCTVRTQAVKTYRHMPKEDNIPLVFGANFHDDPINRNTLRKSHNMMSNKAINSYISNNNNDDVDMSAASSTTMNNNNEASGKYNLPCAYNYTGSVYNDFQSYSPHSRQLHKVSDDDEDNANVWSGWFSEDISEEDTSEFVARFLAYFVERVPESALEEQRVRIVCIKYFVSDHSLSIIEAKQDNSGMEQSTRLARRQVAKESAIISTNRSNNGRICVNGKSGCDRSIMKKSDCGNALHSFQLESREYPESETVHVPLTTASQDNNVVLADFGIGEEVSIYGTRYTIVDMDKRTRKYFAQVYGQVIPNALSIPQDTFTEIMNKKKEAHLSTHRLITSDDMDHKRVIEQQRTGIYSKHCQEDIAIAQKFLEHRINEHLSYCAVWDDREHISGDVHECVIRLYLENSSIEIAERKWDNCGYCSGPILLAKQRVPCSSYKTESSRFQQHTYGKLMKTDYLTPEHIQIGDTLYIYGKPFFIYDCDAFTRRYVKEHYQVTLHEAIDISALLKEERKPLLFHIPPPNGFGSEHDTRTNWLSLIAKPAKPNEAKLRKEMGRVMHFAARLAKPIVESDKEREFVVSFYRESDEVEVIEKVQLNSGYLGGRFLAKGKHFKELADGRKVPFTPSDFAVGQTVTIYSRPFVLLDMDENTRRILSNTDNPLTDDRIRYYVNFLKEQLRLKYTHIKEAYLALASHGMIGYKQVQDFLRSYSCHLTDKEALLVIQNLSPGTDGLISYDKFIEIMNPNNNAQCDDLCTLEEVQSKSRSSPTLNSPSSTSATNTETSKSNTNVVDMTVKPALKQTAAHAALRHHANKLKKLLRDKFSQHTGSLRQRFIIMTDRSGNCRLGRVAFREFVREIMNFSLSSEDEELLVAMVFDDVVDENDTITYNQFQEFVEGSLETPEWEPPKKKK